MTDDDRLIESMFDEVVETHVGKDGSVEAKLVSPSAEEMEEAVADFVKSAREFRDLNSRPDAATAPERPGILWWRALEWLALADSRLKDVFCGRDRSPRSIRQFHKFRLKMIAGRRYRTDA